MNYRMESIIDSAIKEHNDDNQIGEFKGSIYQEMDWWYDVNDNVRINIHNFGTKTRYKFKVDLYVSPCAWVNVKTFDIREYRNNKKKGTVCQRKKQKRK